MNLLFRQVLRTRVFPIRHEYIERRLLFDDVSCIQHFFYVSVIISRLTIVLEEIRMLRTLCLFHNTRCSHPAAAIQYNMMIKTVVDSWKFERHVYLWRAIVTLLF